MKELIMSETMEAFFFKPILSKHFTPIPYQVFSVLHVCGHRRGTETKKPKWSPQINRNLEFSSIVGISISAINYVEVMKLHPTLNRITVSNSHSDS